MTKRIKKNKVMYHIGLSKEMIQGAEYVLLPGDPGRVPVMAKCLDKKAKQVNFHREYNAYLCDFNKQKILVCSTGIGCPSTGIAIEELASIGLKYFIRVGSTGTIQPNINLGDIIINNAAVRLEGTSMHYAPIEYPAVASLELTNALLQAAKKVSKAPYHLGITISSDTFYPGQERYDSFLGFVPRRFMGSVDEWRTLKITNFEMEASTIFVLCSIFGLHGAAINGVIAKRTESESANIKAISIEHMMEIIAEAIRLHMKVIQTAY